VLGARASRAGSGARESKGRSIEGRMIGRRRVGRCGRWVGVPVCRRRRAGVGLAVAAAIMSLTASAAHAGRAREEAPADIRDAKTEFGIVPIAGGSTDYGLGGGFLTNLAGLDPAVSPYVWRLEAAAFITFKAKDA